MAAAGEALEGCLQCGRNIEKANCGKVFGKKHEIAFQLNHLERRDKESPTTLTKFDMEVYATGCYPAKSDSTNQMLASRTTIEQVRAKVDAYAYKWRA
jgi:hypothetical protein